MAYSRIAGIGSCLPEKILTNADLEAMVDTTDEWIQKRVGIQERRIVGASGETTGSLALSAAKAALASSGVDPEAIGLIITATVTPDCLFPGVACTLQSALEIKNECPAFDLNAACAGFIYAMSIADQYIKNGVIKAALIVGVESLSHLIDWKDRSTCVLFGDGAGAVVMQASDEPGVIHTRILSDGRFANLLYAKNSIWTDEAPSLLRMDGRAVFKMAVAELGAVVDETLDAAGLSRSDIDWLIPHQANARIIEATAKRLGLPMERVILTIAQHGNTSSASVPLALDHAVRAGRVKRGEILMLEAFGAGLAWGAALLKF